MYGLEEIGAGAKIQADTVEKRFSRTRNGRQPYRSTKAATDWSNVEAFAKKPPAPLTFASITYQAKGESHGL